MVATWSGPGVGLGVGLGLGLGVGLGLGLGLGLGQGLGLGLGLEVVDHMRLLIVGQLRVLLPLTEGAQLDGNLV